MGFWGKRVTQVNLIDGSTATIDGLETVIGDLAITQGATYQISFNFTGDYSTYSPRSQIRSGYLADNGELLASFSFLPLSYDAVNNKTQITLTLSDELSSSLPPTKYQGSGRLNTSSAYVYDVELEAPTGEVVKVISASFVQVKPEVTGAI